MNSRLACFRVVYLLTLCLAAATFGCSESHVPMLTDSGPGGGVDAPISPRVDTGPVTGIDSGPIMDFDGGPVTGTDSGPVTLLDSGPVTGTDAGPVVLTDAGPPGVACGSATCLDPQICCVTFSGGGPGGGTPTFTCTTAAGCMGVAAACDGPEDCATGEVCCGMRMGMGASTSCVPEASCTFGRLCHTAVDCDMGDMCCSFMGASICSGFGCFP